MSDQSAPRVRAHLTLHVNGEPMDVSFDSYKTLLEVLREDLGLPGTKHGCELGECGACAVLLDGEPVLSCLVLGVECDGRSITTVEGLSTDGRLDPLQAAFADLGGAQCGYCTPGLLITARALLDRTPHPTREAIREALSGNLCRCTGYQQIFEAVEAAIEQGQQRPRPGRAEDMKIRGEASASVRAGGGRLRAEGASASLAGAPKISPGAEAGAPAPLKDTHRSAHE